MQRAAQNFVAGLDKPSRVTAIGATVAAVAFFLPQFEFPGQREYPGTGFDMGGTYIFKFLAALVILALVYYREITGKPLRVRLACAQLALGSAYGVGVLTLIGGWPGFGFFVLSVGFVTAAIGAYMSIAAETT